jgi:hypothetical protein
MPEIRKTITLLGNDIHVVDVPIQSALEFFSEYELEDGSKIKVKSVATSFLRVEGEYAADGSPIYLVFTSPALNVTNAPPELMRPASPTQAN